MNSDFDLAAFKRQQALRESGCPERHVSTLSDYGVREGMTGQVCKVMERLGTGAIIALIGPRGTGKTQLAVDAVKAVVLDDGKTARYVKAVQFFMAIKATFRKGADQSEEKVISDFAKPSLLVLDEISERGETDWEERMFKHLIDRRYDAKRDTILIGNFEKAAFDKSVGDSILSRINETGGIIVCNWASFR